MRQREQRRRVYLTSKRAHCEIMEALCHMHKHQVEILERLEQMANELDRIEAEVTEISGTVDSAVTLLGSLAQLIRDNAGSPARLNKIADDLDAKGNALAEAVAANDPNVEPPPVEEPPVEEPLP